MVSRIILILILSFFNSIFPQNSNEYLSLNFEELDKAVTDTNSKYFYSTLLNRYLENDVTLNNIDIFMLCYGYSKSHLYNPYEQMEKDDELFDLNRRKEYRRAIEYGEKYLIENPVSLRGNLEVAYAYKKIGNTEKEEIYFNRYKKIVESIKSSGTGDSLHNAYIIFNPKDEKKILGYLGFDIISQELVEDDLGQHYDLIKVKSRKNEDDLREIYFFIELPYKTLSNIFK